MLSPDYVLMHFNAATRVNGTVGVGCGDIVKTSITLDECDGGYSGGI
jgi:hypothetical protein